MITRCLVFLLVLHIQIQVSASYQIPTNPHHHHHHHLKLNRGRIHPLSESKLFLFDRLYRVISSNVNYYLKKMEDPEKIIEQSVIDMQSDLQRTRQSYAEVYALLKKLEKRRDDSLKASHEYFRKAELAIKLGHEQLARDALSARLRHISLSEKFGDQIQQQKLTVERLHSAMASLEEKISQAKLQKDEYIVRAKAAKSRIEVNQLLSTVSSSTSVDAFEKMKDKVESLEVQANLNDDINELSNNTDKKLQVMEQNEVVEKELQSLRDSFIVNRAIFTKAKPTQTSIPTGDNFPL